MIAGTSTRLSAFTLSRVEKISGVDHAFKHQDWGSAERLRIAVKATRVSDTS